MGDYVKRSDILERFTFEHGDRIPEVCEDGKDNTISFRDAKAVIRSLPAADVAPVVHARWIVKKVGYAKTLAFCSACGCQSSTNSQRFHEQGADITEYTPILTKYCPECGAKLDLEG